MARTREQPVSVAEEHRRQRRVLRRMLAGGLFIALVFAMVTVGTAPRPAAITLALYLVLAIWILGVPSAGVYIVVFLTLLGDSVVSSWYPFAKNLSSAESLSYVSDALTFQPLELLLGVTFLAWWWRSLAEPGERVIERTRLLWPMVVFAVIVVLGIARAFVGVGDFRIALFEARPLLYMPLLYFLITQLLTTRRQYIGLWVAAIAAITGQSIIAIVYFRGLESTVRSDLESLTEHSASVHLAALFIILLASFLLPRCSWRLRLPLLLVSIPGVIVFGLSQRRSAAVGLAVGVILLLIVLAAVRPTRLIWALPTFVLSSVLFLAATWNAQGSLGLASQAVKSVVAPEQLANVDRNSNIYRQIEAFDIWFTIRTQPLTGVGFGNPFYQPWPLPYLPGFEFRNFIPHNTLLWIWLKLGVVGFVTTLFLLARAIQFGARTVVRLRSGDVAALAMGSVAYVTMFTVFAYVDIAWDARSTTFLAVAMAWCADLPSIASDEPPPDAPASLTLAAPGGVVVPTDDVVR